MDAASPASFRARYKSLVTSGAIEADPAQARAVEALEKDPRPFIKYFVAETGGRIEERDFQSWRLLHGPPTEYTRERFDDEYNWTVKWNMTVPGATYENTVDNRAWK